MHLMYHLDENGKRVYTLKVRTTESKDSDGDGDNGNCDVDVDDDEQAKPQWSGWLPARLSLFALETDDSHRYWCRYGQSSSFLTLTHCLF